MRFTIRLKPQDGESLSSYLLRCCQVNSMTLEGLWRLICLSKTEGIKRRAVYSWDINPYLQLDIKKAAYLTGQSEEVLESLTCLLVWRKLITREMNKATLRSLSFEGQQYIHRNSRKICSECIAQGEGHKLIWNIKGIEYCEKHKCMLIDSCPDCKSQFEYSDGSVLEGSCSHCQNVLTTEQIEDKGLSILKNNNLYDLSWKWLLSNKKCDNQNQYSIGSLLGLKLMFATQNSNIERINTIRWYYGLKTAVNTGKKNITLLTAFNVVELSKKSLCEIDKIKLSDETIEDINNFPKRKFIPLGVCLAPWCSSYSTNEQMLRVSNPHWFIDRSSYNECSVCTGCYMEYGYSKVTGEWKNTGEAIRIIQEVQNLKKELFSNTAIKKAWNRSYKSF